MADGRNEDIRERVASTYGDAPRPARPEVTVDTTYRLRLSEERRQALENDRQAANLRFAQR